MDFEIRLFGEPTILLHVLQNLPRRAGHPDKPSGPIMVPMFLDKFSNFQLTMIGTFDHRPFTQSFACEGPTLDATALFVIEVQASNHVNGAEY